MLQYSKSVMAAVEVLFLLVYAITTARGQTCTVPSDPVVASSEIAYLSSCVTIYGDLVLGYQNCDQICSITDLSVLSQLRNIEGSLIIQCCNTLTSIPTLFLTSITGSLSIYYNSALRNIDNLGSLATVGSLVISQNPSLQTISGLTTLQTVGGHLVIEHNPALTSITGLSSLATISGGSLVNGHALVLLHNRALTDIIGFGSLSSITYGTVHLEGNELLCYAGYPLWTYGDYSPRYRTGDMGIDWRRKLSIPWQYTWGDGEPGEPTLLIRDNGNQTTCADASCHSSCPNGAGCLGPNNADLCGECFKASGVDSCEESIEYQEISNCVDFWPPTQSPFNVIFGIFIAVLGIFLIEILVVAFICIYKIWSCWRNPNKGSYLAGRSDYSVHYQAASSKPTKSPLESNNVGPKFSTPVKSTPVKTAPVKSQPQTKHSTPLRKSSQYSKDSQDSFDSFEGDVPVTFKEEAPADDTEAKPLDYVSYGRPVEQTDAKVEDTDPLEFPAENIELLEELGEGVFGSVYLAEAKGIIEGEDATEVVVKASPDDATEKELAAFLKPAEAMRDLRHKNVLALLGVSIDGDNIMIIMESCSEGNLKNFLRKSKSLASKLKTSGAIFNMVIEMGEGLEYLHALGIANNDFAARNCQVTADRHIKIGDYGLSRHNYRGDYYARTPGHLALPIRWMSPEITVLKQNGLLESKPVTALSNIWAFGIALWEVCSFGERPYKGMTDEEVVDQLKTSGYCNITSPVDDNDPLHPLYGVMKKCWVYERNRPSIGDILEQLEHIRDNYKPPTKSKMAVPGRRPISDMAKSRNTKKSQTRKDSQQPLMDTTDNTPPSSPEVVVKSTKPKIASKPVRLAADKPSHHAKPHPYAKKHSDDDSSPVLLVSKNYRHDNVSDEEPLVKPHHKKTAATEPPLNARYSPDPSPVITRPGKDPSPVATRPGKDPSPVAIRPSQISKEAEPVIIQPIESVPVKTLPTKKAEDTPTHKEPQPSKLKFVPPPPPLPLDEPVKTTPTQDDNESIDSAKDSVDSAGGYNFHNSDDDEILREDALPLEDEGDVPPPPVDFSQEERRPSQDERRFSTGSGWDEFEPGDQDEAMNTLGRNKKFKSSYTPEPDEREMEQLQETALATAPQSRPQDEEKEAGQEEPPPAPLTLLPGVDDDDTKPFDLEELEQVSESVPHAHEEQPKDGTTGVETKGEGTPEGAAEEQPPEDYDPIYAEPKKKPKKSKKKHKHKHREGSRHSSDIGPPVPEPLPDPVKDDAEEPSPIVPPIVPPQDFTDEDFGNMFDPDFEERPVSITPTHPTTPTDKKTKTVRKSSSISKLFGSKGDKGDKGDKKSDKKSKSKSKSPEPEQPSALEF